MGGVVEYHRLDNTAAVWPSTCPGHVAKCGTPFDCKVFLHRFFNI